MYLTLVWSPGHISYSVCPVTMINRDTLIEQSLQKILIDKPNMERIYFIINHTTIAMNKQAQNYRAIITLVTA